MQNQQKHSAEFPKYLLYRIVWVILMNVLGGTGVEQADTIHRLQFALPYQQSSAEYRRFLIANR